MQMEESLPMHVFLCSLESLGKIRGEFDHILTGHTRKYPEDASLCEAQRRAVKEVLDGKNEDDMPYEWYGGSAVAHPYGPEPRRIVYRRGAECAGAQDLFRRLRTEGPFDDERTGGEQSPESHAGSGRRRSGRGMFGASDRIFP